MPVPNELLISLENVPGFDRKAFEEVHASGEQVTAIRINPNKYQIDNPKSTTPVPWSLFGYYLSQRPSFTFDPLFHAGCYYVQDASSMFLEQALKQTVDLCASLKVLDLCAAPGGKSTHIQSLLSPGSLLVSNEVIKPRAAVLKQNIYKWGSTNTVVTNNDPHHFKKLEGFFDVIVVDAPCSGSGLFRKDPEAIKEWSEGNVHLCYARQKRILADALPALKEGGVLIYATCSYSQEEDEEIADWLVQELNMNNEPLTIKDEWGIVETKSLKTKAIGYRFFPYKLKGEGFFLSCFRKTETENTVKYKQVNLEQASAKEQAIIKPWLQNSDELVFLKEHFAYALPKSFLKDYSAIKHALNIQYAGVAIGEIMKDKLVPDHALALSTILSGHIPKTELSYDEAIRYLQRADLQIEPRTKGWQPVSYQHHNLGWINALPNRINNYYPKELRILKERNDSAFEK
jgi:16S rRNA C967 or C1407 C5-methylase (RsmB/RsmF family)/NOL1/NOP2/fmu family ribosome biogenesis protein